MSNLTPEQIQACRANPLAAYLARRLPAMLITVTALNLACLMLVVLAAAYAITPSSMPASPWAHFATLLLLAVITTSGLILGFELRWMHRNQISPELLEHSPLDTGGFPTDGPARMRSHLERRLDEAVESKAKVYTWHDTVNTLRSWGCAFGREHAGAGTAMEKEYLRSLEIQALALADTLEGGCRSIEEKQERGYKGSQAGFRQKEMTRDTMQRIVRIAQASMRTLHAPKKNNKKHLQRGNC